MAIVSTEVPKDIPVFWVAKLSNGLEVFEDFRIGFKGSWLRLKDLLKNEGWGVKMLSLVSPSSVILLPEDKNHDGFFYSQRVDAYASGDLNFQKFYKGIGYYKDGQVYITWLNVGSGEVTNEVRTVNSDNPSIILRVSDNSGLLS